MEEAEEPEPEPPPAADPPPPPPNPDPGVEGWFSMVDPSPRLPAGAPAAIAVNESSSVVKGTFDNDEATEMSHQPPASPAVIDALTQLIGPALRAEIVCGRKVRDDWGCAGDIEISDAVAGATEVVTPIEISGATSSVASL